MNRLNRLLLNPEKLISNENLINLRGGAEIAGCAARLGEQCWDNLSMAGAIHMASCENPDGTNCDGNWCCDSCEGASWYPCQ